MLNASRFGLQRPGAIPKVEKRIMQSSHASRHAQQVLTVARGDLSPFSQITDPSVARSWLRCLEQHQLDPAKSAGPSVLEHASMIERRERLHRVLEIANGEMSNLHQQLAGSGHAVLLTDARGVILNRVTSEAEQRTFERAGLWLGADWSEACEGTNGIGTCVVERQAMTIHQSEHFRADHTILTCSASPVFDTHGELLAILDVSSARNSMSRQSQFHTMALVNLSAKLIEGSYFLRQFEHDYLLRFHGQADFVGSLSEGLLAFGADGRVVALNQSALNLLGASREQLLGQSVETLFDVRLDQLLQRAGRQPAASWQLYASNGRILHAQLRGDGLRLQRGAVSPAGMPQREEVCLGDAGLRLDFARALRVYERDVPLLLQGETGSGKEVFAKAIHQACSRSGKPFVALNCAAIPENLIESELFGYRGGSFTGARREGMRGRLLQADGGTLFLDEIGDMPLMLQTRLLRVLEERQVEPIGGEPVAVNLRLISATHRDLHERVAAGEFREDLYYRLTGLALNMPPLRERSDKGELLDHLLHLESQGCELRLEPPAREALLAHAWPGNVRQLRNTLRTLAALCDGALISLADLPAALRNPPLGPLNEAPTLPLQTAERDALLKILEQHCWHVSRCAKQLGVSRNTLYRKLRRHGITRV